jgi:hypothetical protein
MDRHARGSVVLYQVSHSQTKFECLLLVYPVINYDNEKGQDKIGRDMLLCPLSFIIVGISLPTHFSLRAVLFVLILLFLQVVFRRRT